MLQVCVASIGSKEAADVLRRALAMGATRAIHVTAPSDPTGLLSPEPLAVSQVLAALARRNSTLLPSRLIA